MSGNRMLILIFLLLISNLSAILTAQDKLSIAVLSLEENGISPAGNILYE